MLVRSSQLHNGSIYLNPERDCIQTTPFQPTRPSKPLRIIGKAISFSQIPHARAGPIRSTGFPRARKTGCGNFQRVLNEVSMSR